MGRLWYESDMEQVQELGMAALLRNRANVAPQATAILAENREPLTYEGLWAHVVNVARVLSALRLSPKDRIAIVLPDGPEMAMAFLCVSSLATAAPLNPRYWAPEFEFFLSDLQPRLVVLPEGQESPAREIAQQNGIQVLELLVPDRAAAGCFEFAGLGGGKAASSGDLSFGQAHDVALMLHTSGTTSRPKIVPLTHRNLLSSARHICGTLALSPTDRCLNIMPLFHIHGLIGATLSSLSAGASLVCTPGFMASRFFEWLDEFRPTWFTAVPAMHQVILGRAPDNADTIARCPLRFVRSSSSALPTRVMRGIEAAFAAPLLESYGMTEASHQIASNPLPPRARKAGSVGIAAGPDIAILDATGNVQPANTTGEIAIRGPNVTNGYELAPQANAAAFAKGWFRTGDQGYLDADGYLFITGRLKELINRGGEKISPREIDEVLMSHPAVETALAFAIPDLSLGEEVGAAVVLKKGMAASAEEIQEFGLGKLADFKVPRRVVIVPEIPKGPTGKSQRIGLAERLGVKEQAPLVGQRPDLVAPRNEIERTVARFWCEVLGLREAGVKDRFLESGGDSIGATRLIARLREEFGCQISVLAFFQSPSIASLAEWIEKDQREANQSRSMDQVLDELESLSDEDAERLLAQSDRQTPENQANESS